MSFAENLKKARLKSGYTQLELAQVGGIAQPQYAQYEMGLKLPNVITASLIAKKLNVSLDDLVGGDDGKAEDDTYA